MLQRFANIITAVEHDDLLSLARATAFVPGTESASPRLADIKRNEQMARADPAVGTVAKLVGAALGRHSAFRARAAAHKQRRGPVSLVRIFLVAT